MKDTTTNRLRVAMTLRGLKQVDLVEKTGLTKSAISQYCSGKFQPKQKAIFLLSKALNVNEAWLMGHDVQMEKNDNLEVKKIPIIEIFEGNKTIVNYCDFVTDKLRNCDYCLKIRNDSMINARIKEGDFIFIESCENVLNGSIMALVMNDEVIIKRVYKNDDDLTLIAENPLHKPINIPASKIQILGKAVAFQSSL